MSAWAKPGVKCVCVDASAGWTGKPTNLVERVVYTIREVVPANPNWTHNGDGPGIHLVEVSSCRPEGFRAARFRPLTARTQEDDVRLIKSLLLEDAGLVPAGVELDA